MGLSGLFSKKAEKNAAVAAFVGCFARFIIHYISGFTVYARWMPEEFMGMAMTSPFIYSLLYNGTYMLPNTVLCVIVVGLLARPLRRFLRAK